MVNGRTLKDQPSKYNPLMRNVWTIIYVNRPEVWADGQNRLGNRVRPFHRYNKEWHGHAPKPNWNITQRDFGGRRGTYAGAGAKVVWKPPGKTQRVSVNA